MREHAVFDPEKITGWDSVLYSIGSLGDLYPVSFVRYSDGSKDPKKQFTWSRNYSRVPADKMKWYASSVLNVSEKNMKQMEKDTGSEWYYQYGSYYYFSEYGRGSAATETVEDLKVTTDGPYCYVTYSIRFTVDKETQWKEKYSAVVARKYDNGTYYWSIFSGKILY